MRKCVLEGEILRRSWFHTEGPFAEFNRLMAAAHEPAGAHQVDHVIAKTPCTTPAKCLGKISGCRAVYEAAARRVLFEAGVQTAAINVTPGGCCHWHIVASIKKVPGDGKNAIMALLSIADIKHVTIVDDDIDVFDPVDVEWAVATRVQADRDVVIISNARSKPLDPHYLPLHGKCDDGEDGHRCDDPKIFQPNATTDRLFHQDKINWATTRRR